MRITFVCHTIYQVFVSYVITKTEYSDSIYITTIILEDNTNHLKNNAIKIGIWDRVEVISSHDSEENLLKIFRKLDILNTDILHIFAFGSLVSNLISNNAKKDTKIISTEEGFTVYSWNESYEKWNKKNRWFDEKYMLDSKRIQEGIFFESRVVDDSLPIVKRNINLKKFFVIIQSQGINELNELFQYNHKMEKRNNVFFDTYLNSIKVIGDDYQKFIISEIAECFSRNQLLYLKKHPSELSSAKFVDYNNKEDEIQNIKYIKESIVPWEVIFLNEVFVDKNTDDRLYISYSSTTVFNCMIFGNNLGVDVEIICIADCINKFEKNRFSTHSKILKKYQEIYDNNKIHLLDEVGEIKDVIKKSIDKNYEATIENHKITKEKELDWFRKYYINKYDEEINNREYLLSQLIVNDDYFNFKQLNKFVHYEKKIGFIKLSFNFCHETECRKLKLVISEDKYIFNIEIRNILINENKYLIPVSVNSSNNEVELEFYSAENIRSIKFEFNVVDFKNRNGILERLQINTQFLKNWIAYDNIKELNTKLNKYRNIYLFSASDYSKLFIECLKKKNIKINGVIDNYDENAEFSGYKIVRVNTIMNLKDIETIIVTMPARFDEIAKGINAIRNDIEIVNINNMFS